MIFPEALQAILVGSAPLIAVVPAIRITPSPLPQNQVLPAITWELTGGPVAYAFGADPNIRQPRVQFDVWGRTFSDASTAAELLRARVANYQGSQVGDTYTLVFQGSFLESEPFHLHEFDTGLHRLTFDATFHYSIELSA